MQEIAPRLLIIASNRSGTKYISRVLNNAGVRIGHEIPGRDGLATGYWCPSGVGGYDVVIHQVRNPVNTIASMATLDQKTFEYLCRHYDVDAGTPVVERCCEIWHRQNWAAWWLARLTYRIEDLEFFWEEVKLAAGTRASYEVATRDVPKNLNTRPHVELTWDQLSPGVIELAETFGYTEG